MEMPFSVLMIIFVLGFAGAILAGAAIVENVKRLIDEVRRIEP
jgi:phosphate/sulfate permease